MPKYEIPQQHVSFLLNEVMEHIPIKGRKARKLMDDIEHCLLSPIQEEKQSKELKTQVNLDGKKVAETVNKKIR